MLDGKWGVRMSDIYGMTPLGASLCVNKYSEQNICSSQEATQNADLPTGYEHNLSEIVYIVGSSPLHKGDLLLKQHVKF